MNPISPIFSSLLPSEENVDYNWYTHFSKLDARDLYDAKECDNIILLIAPSIEKDTLTTKDEVKNLFNCLNYYYEQYSIEGICVENFKFTTQAFKAFLDCLSEAKWCNFIKINNMQFVDNPIELQDLAQITHAKTLSLDFASSFAGTHVDTLTIFASLMACCTQVESLSLTNIKDMSEPDFLKIIISLSECEKLESLLIKNVDFPENYFAAFGDVLSSLENLTSLTVKDVTGASWTSFEGISGCDKLTTFHIQGAIWIEDHFFKLLFHPNSLLQNLTLKECCFDTEIFGLNVYKHSRKSARPFTLKLGEEHIQILTECMGTDFFEGINLSSFPADFYLYDNTVREAEHKITEQRTQMEYEETTRAGQFLTRLAEGELTQESLQDVVNFTSPFGDLLIDVRLSALAIFLELSGFKIYEIPPDGNCLFHAFAFIQDIENKVNPLVAQPTSHETVRNDLIAFMRIHETLPYYLDDPEITEMPISAEEMWQLYCNKMACLTVWGGHLELAAFSELYQRYIVIYDSESTFTISDGILQPLEIMCVGDSTHKPLYLMRSRNHYMAVIKLPTKTLETTKRSRAEFEGESGSEEQEQTSSPKRSILMTDEKLDY